MRVLRQGLSGDDVKALQYFLRGEELYQLRVDGIFGGSTTEAVKQFQGLHNLTPDGVVGRMTYAAAFKCGFDPLIDEDTSEDGPNWPPPPEDLKPLGSSGREQVFGHIEYRPAGTSDNPEGIVITNDWAKKNIVSVKVPQLLKIPGIFYDGRSHGRAPQSGAVAIHKLAGDAFSHLWDTWEEEGLLHLVVTWGGLWNPRFIRGSRTILSNHAYGTAFDINVGWNMLGKQPALKGRPGSVRELVGIANDMGWFWGGHYPAYNGRPDGMHLELARV